MLRVRCLALVIAAAMAMAMVVATVPGVAGAAPERVSVIVIARAGRVPQVAAAVDRLGGDVTAALPIIGGLSADVPVTAVEPLRRDRSVVALRSDDSVGVQSSPSDGSDGRTSNYRDALGATALGAAGRTGHGVTVALVDTGVSPVPDLARRLVPIRDDATGEVSDCVDFSGEGHCRDSYGHGTFMAGIIAGEGSSSGGDHAGVAPGARVLSVKVAGADGSSDVSKVIAAIQWVVSHKDDYGIRVLNLSLGTDSTQPWDVDPFNYAVERAWEAGITVLVAASNRGPSAHTVSKPGDDPWVLTVGAVDDRGTPAVSDDRLPDFSSRGPTVAGVAKPDVVAPGVRMVSLRAPGSTIDERFPAVVDAQHRRGSGTSMATAAVSGGVALLLEQHPDWTPAHVKQALRSTAGRTASNDPAAVGAGMVDLVAAAASEPGPAPSPPRRSSGRGSLDASRGSVVVDGSTVGETADSVAVASGTLLWDPVGFTTGEWSARTWPLSPWAHHRWHTTSWHGDNWHGDNWHGDNWHGDNWHGDNWHGDNWHGDWEGSSGADSTTYPETYGEPWMGGAWYGVWG